MWQVVQRKEKTNTTYMQKMWYAHDIEKQRYCDCEKNYIWIERSKGREMKMREILFKAKRIDNGEWVEGYFVKAKRHWHNHGIHEDWIVTMALQNGGWLNASGRHAIDINTLCQYTGLTDKNGNKIWENDVVRHLEHGEIYKCYWYCENCEYSLCNESDSFGLGYCVGTELEVIGTIFDNPELLGGGE